MNKESGELAELKFAVRANEQGLIISAPFGDSCEYDFITDFNGKLTRVQVKSCWTKNIVRDRYMTKAGKGLHKCSYERVDIIVVYVDYHDTWYLIPHDELKGKSICLYPHRDVDGLYEKFREAWDLLK